METEQLARPVGTGLMVWGWGWGWGDYLVSRHVYTFQARSGWKGMNELQCFTWSPAGCRVWWGLVEPLCFLWTGLKIAAGTWLRGRGGGSLGAGWG